MSLFKKPVNKYTKVFWVLFTFPFLLIFVIIMLAASGEMGYMPKIEDLENPKINLATQIISSDGEILGSIYYKNQNRTYVGFEHLPKHLVDALIATEDIRFYRHSGIDIKGLTRAFVYMGRRGGGSTITQQLATQLFHERAIKKIQRLKQKIKEWIIAVKLERSYTKEEIIALYFNQFDFLYNAVGIKSAAQVYFNTIPDSLSIEQSAVLVGMAQNPARHNPKINPENSLIRRNIVLSQMAKYGYISDQVKDSIIALPLKLQFHRLSHNIGLATYFREYIRRTLSADEPVRKDYASWNYQKYKEDSIQWADNPLYGWCNKNSKPDGQPYDLYTDGLRIYTTINSRIQTYAEYAVEKHLGSYLQPLFFKEKKGKRRAPFTSDLTNKQIDQIIWNSIRYSERGIKLFNQGVSMDSIYRVFRKPVPMTVFSWKGEIDTVMSPLDSILYFKHFLHTGFLAMEPTTGYVRAYVGGLNFRYFKYDHVTQGKRQAGSTFKPFLYILAMQEGYSPCREVPVSPTTFYVTWNGKDTTWTPRTTARKSDIGTMKPLKWGLAKSENYVSAWLVERFKPQPIADIAYKMGIKSYIDPVPSLIYGPSDMTVEEMVGAYTPFANQGVHIDPLYVTRIEDKYGNVLATFIPYTHESISEETAYLMLNLMQGVADYGTAAGLRSRYNLTGRIAAKTGTTNNHSDGWFIGIVPKLIGGCWVGAEEPSVHFDGIRLGSGTSMAMPIWGEFMKRVYADSTLGIYQEDDFIAPEDFDMSILDCDDQRFKDELQEEDEFDFDVVY
ncbi:MAG: transglycosylase domain-containing protein [Bacteroidales bacterium]|nr:transglycosylase domain-containing protein [Bacteroidales bacterium]